MVGEPLLLPPSRMPGTPSGSAPAGAATIVATMNDGEIVCEFLLDQIVQETLRFRRADIPPHPFDQHRLLQDRCGVFDHGPEHFRALQEMANAHLLAIRRCIIAAEGEIPTPPPPVVE
jgi:hypothetical protein